MAKIELSKPVLICLYGYPGSGKSYVARHLAETIQLAQISSDRIRSELFQNPRFDAQENSIVAHLMDYLTAEFLDAGVSVVYDGNSSRSAQRRKLQEMARKHHAEFLLIWIQIDMESAYARTQGRDRRTSDDKYAEPQTKSSFEERSASMQNPDGDYAVISGKHTFNTQKSAVINHLYHMGVVRSGAVQRSITKPELVNLIPNPTAGRVDMSRRNIRIE